MRTFARPRASIWSATSMHSFPLIRRSRPTTASPGRALLRGHCKQHDRIIRKPTRAAPVHAELCGAVYHRSSWSQAPSLILMQTAITASSRNAAGDRAKGSTRSEIRLSGIVKRLRTTRRGSVRRVQSEAQTPSEERTLSLSPKVPRRGRIPHRIFRSFPLTADCRTREARLADHWPEATPRTC